MHVTIERQENCIVKLTIEVDERNTTGYLRRAARALSRQYRLPGFRPGKAPYDVVVQRLGLEAVQAQAVEQFGDQVFEQGLEESELEPVGQASLEEVTWEPTMALHLTVPVGPEVRLGAYQDIRVPWREPQVTDQELDEELARLQEQQAEREASERPAELGDEIVADITALVAGETVLENTGRELVLDAESPYPVPGFAEAVVGIEVDETREFTLPYPEDHYNADIAGEEGHFTVHVSEIRTEVLPELDDEFAMSVGDYEDLDDLKAKVRQSLQESAENAAEQEFEEALWQELLEVAEVEYPDVSVDREVDLMERRFAGQLQSQGIDIDSFFQLTNTTQEGWRADIRPQAIEQMKRRVTLIEVAQDQDIAVEDDEIEARIEETLEPLSDENGEVRELLESEDGRLSLKEDLLREKAMDYLKSVTRVEAEAEGAEPEEEVAEEEAATAETAEEEAAIEDATDQEEPTEGAPSEAALEGETAETGPAEAEEAAAPAPAAEEEAAAKDATDQEEPTESAPSEGAVEGETAGTGPAETEAEGTEPEPAEADDDPEAPEAQAREDEDTDP